MKIIDETGTVVETPDLTLGYLVEETEAVEHPAQEEVPEQSHYETVAQYPNGGEDVRKIIDREGVPAKEAWTEQVSIRRYLRYTAEELAAQEQARKEAEERARLPETVKALQAALDDADALNVDQEYRLTLLELGLSE